MFALHMPGFDPSDLPQDVNPDNTFPIVFTTCLATTSRWQSDTEQPSEDANDGMG